MFLFSALLMGAPSRAIRGCLFSLISRLFHSLSVSHKSLSLYLSFSPLPTSLLLLVVGSLNKTWNVLGVLMFSTLPFSSVLVLHCGPCACPALLWASSSQLSSALLSSPLRTLQPQGFNLSEPNYHQSSLHQSPAPPTSSNPHQ